MPLATYNKHRSGKTARQFLLGKVLKALFGMIAYIVSYVGGLVK